MNQTERRIYLVKELLKEQENRNLSIPENENEQKHLLRSLMNVRMPASIGQKFLKIQDEYLQQAVTEKELRISGIYSRYVKIFIYGREI